MLKPFTERQKTLIVNNIVKTLLITREIICGIISVKVKTIMTIT